MIKAFAKTQQELEETNIQIRHGNRKTIEYLIKKNIKGRILDIGQRSPLTQQIEEAFKIKIDSTDGDLDGDFKIPGKDYDVVIFSHTLEHIFDPVHCLLKIKGAMKPGSEMFIMLPRRGKLLWARNHYHEIDHYRIQKLMQRTGLKIVSWKHSKVWRPPHQYFKGLRSFYRLFREYNITYQIQKKS